MKLINRGTLMLSLAAGIILIGISLVFTANFFFSLSTGFLAYCFATFGVINDFGKVIFLPAILYSLSKDKMGHVAYFIILWSVCFTISLVASQSFDLNKKNEIKNKTLIESSGYQRQTDLFNSSKDTITTLKQDIANLKSSRGKDEQKIIDRYAPLIQTARKLNMLTINRDSVTEISKRRDAEIKQLDSTISEKEKLILSKESSLVSINQNFSTVGTTVEHTEGLIAFSQWLSSLFGGNPDKVIGWFYIVKNVFSEFLALGLLLLGGMELKELVHEPKLVPTAPDDKPKKSAQDDNLSENNKILRSPKLVPLTLIKNSKESEFNEAVKAYVTAMDETQNNDICIGYQRISKRAGLTDNMGKEVYGYLKNKGIIHVENGQTKIIRKKLNLA